MMKREVTKVSGLSHALMAVTSAHHVYGAMLYNTPWRLHVLVISIPVIVATAIIHWILVRKNHDLRNVWFLIYWLMVLLPSIVLIGIFEGVYNHALKDILYFAGTDKETLLSLFPPPQYEMPNDFWFEFSGVLQAVIVIPLIVYFIKLMEMVLSSGAAPEPGVSQGNKNS